MEKLLSIIASLLIIYEGLSKYEIIPQIMHDAAIWYYIVNILFAFSIIYLISRFIIYTYELLTTNKIVNDYRLVYKAKKLLNNWIAFREILDEYHHTQNIGLQNKFDETRIKFRSNFNFFSPHMQKMFFLTYSVGKLATKEEVDNIDETYMHTNIFKYIDSYSKSPQIDQCLGKLLSDGRPPEQLYVYDSIFEILIGYYKSHRYISETPQKTNL